MEYYESKDTNTNDTLNILLQHERSTNVQKSSRKVAEKNMSAQNTVYSIIFNILTTLFT